MKQEKRIKYKRINITLPEETIQKLDRISKIENKPKSRVIATTIENYQIPKQYKATKKIKHIIFGE